MDLDYKNVKNIETLVAFLKNKPVNGYTWRVEEKIPEIYNKKELGADDLKAKNNIYNIIQEAYLYDGEHSIHILNSDGNNLVFVNKESDFDEVGSRVKYPSHLKTGEYEIHFKQAYKLKPNNISGASYETYQAVVKLFVGLELKELKD
ncbi:hypothetical protein [Flavivirga jejuensis]|uniref:Uncharacterized protein n=1 Tax=Flavivirga jejuensis TaxID=870487 RepID=A0ABT8WVB6_9FLAO|nr:hypothetical protein [Flavivirga jejuensis]MDO5976944.1 hypothetical protein [Flavivirga jejuensis]